MIPSVFPMQVGPANGPDASAPQSLFTLAQGATQGFDPSIAAAPANSENTLSGQIPSTEGFLHVLDLLLSNTTLPQSGNTSVSNLTVQTSVTTTSADSSKPAIVDSEDDPAKDFLDPSLCTQIASLLQGLGFQVRPEQIAQLSPMDQQQLDSALEFVSRNLQKGTDSSQVAECAALLLPRPWPLDDLSGAPTSNAPTVQGQESQSLPEGFAQSLDEIRSRLHLAVAASIPATQANAAAATKAPSLPIPTSPVAASTHVLPAAKAEIPPKLPDPTTSPALSNFVNTSPPKIASAATAPAAIKADPGPFQDPAIQVLQGLQQSTGDRSDTTTTLVASDIQTRHIPPGGTASEFIGRQVLEKVQVQLSEGRHELSLRLWPEELGEVRLSLTMTQNDKVHGRMVVENESVRQAMLDSMPQLREALTRHGMDLEKMSVSVEQRDAGSPGTGRDDREDRPGRSGRSPDRGGWRDEELSVAVPLTMGRDTGRRNGYNTIDLWS